MRGLGTIINALAIVMGGVLGILFNRFLKGALFAWSIPECTCFVADLSRCIMPSFHEAGNLRRFFPLYQIVFVDINEPEVDALQS